MPRTLRLVAGAAVLTLALAACGSDEPDDTTAEPTSTGGETVDGKIGVILPDTKSSDRWETQDKPLLQAAFDAAGVEADIQNAQGDKAQFQTLADQMITNGATVLMITNLDSGTGKAVQDKAAAQGIPVIDYDRLTLGGSAAYYVSFDNSKVGTLQGQGLADCLGDVEANIVFLNGSPTDNNATLFAQGAHEVLDPMTNFTVVGEQAVPNWDNQQAGTIYEQMLTDAGGDIDGVLAANDGLGNAAIVVNKKNNLRIPVTGQDATVTGLQNVLAGDQCMTVYKAVKQEATAAAELAIALAKGEQPTTTATVTDTETNREVPAVLLDPQAITKDNVQVVLDDGFQTKEAVCTAEFADACAAAGIS
jgi:D-xylose transport system substrate-binding protein